MRHRLLVRSPFLSTRLVSALKLESDRMSRKYQPSIFECVGACVREKSEAAERLSACIHSLWRERERNMMRPPNEPTFRLPSKDRKKILVLCLESPLQSSICNSSVGWRRSSGVEFIRAEGIYRERDSRALTILIQRNESNIEAFFSLLRFRLTIKASCQMDLSDFPMDKQRCPLQMGSCE